MTITGTYVAIAARRADRPVKVADQLPQDTAVNRFIRKSRVDHADSRQHVVCLCLCAVRPDKPPGRDSWRRVDVVSWVAQTFLQLVVSIIMVGQNVKAAAADKRAEATFHDASATLHEVAHVRAIFLPRTSC